MLAIILSILNDRVYIIFVYICPFCFFYYVSFQEILLLNHLYISACTGTGRKVAHRKDDLNELIEHFNVSCLLAYESSCLFRKLLFVSEA